MNLSHSHLVEASISGLIKTVLLIVGAFVLLRFLGQLMIAKRNLEEERQHVKREKDFLKERNQKLKNFGKVTVEKKKRVDNVQDVDYEEIS